MCPEENYVDSSEPWGVVTDHVDWFVAKSHEKRGFLSRDIFINFLYIFTYTAFKIQRWDKAQFYKDAIYQEMVDEELENPKMITVKKSDIRGFRIERLRVHIGYKEEIRNCVCMDYGDTWSTCFQYGQNIESMFGSSYPNDHFSAVHARLLRGLNRQLRPFPQDQEVQKDYERDQLLPGEEWEIDI